MDIERLKAILESLLFAAGEPVPIARLAATLEDVPREELRQALVELGADCNREGRGVMLVEVAGGYQLRTAKEHALYVRKLLATRPPRLSRPILETLAIIAYRQPVTRSEIEQLRGVDSGAVLETLLERQLVRIAGRKEAPGRPQLYATTADFLETFGLKDLDALPDLSELREVEQQIENAGYQRALEAAGEQGELPLNDPQDTAQNALQEREAETDQVQSPAQQTQSSEGSENPPDDAPAADAAGEIARETVPPAAPQVEAEAALAPPDENPSDPERNPQD